MRCSVIMLALLLSAVLPAVQAEKQPTLEELLKIWKKSQPTASADNASKGEVFKNSVGMEFVLIPAGEFTIGEDCPADDPFTGKVNEFAECMRVVGNYTLKKVTIAQSFYMGKYEVTQEQWVKVMGTKENGNNPSHFQSEEVGGNSRQHPVDSVSWADVQTFIQKLNTLESTDKYRLPTEAEWEYAVRGGTSTLYFFGNDSKQLGEYAWFAENSEQKTHPVGQKKANPFGLYDILGNVWEWTCSDYGESYGSGKESACSKDANGNKSLRGGSWYDDSNSCRVAVRKYLGTTGGNYFRGFRVVVVLP